MKKHDNGLITFEKDQGTRAIEKARIALKRLGFIETGTIYRDKYTLIQEGIIRRECTIELEDMLSSIEYKEYVRYYVLIRVNASRYVAMNEAQFRLEKANGTNPLLVLADTRHDYPPKYAMLNDIETWKLSHGKTPIVLFDEDFFSETLEEIL